MAAKSLPMPEQSFHVKKNGLPETELDKILNNAKINPLEEIGKPPIILTIKDYDGKNGSVHYLRRVFTLGNFSCIIGKAKSKKTFFISLVVSALLMGKDSNKKIAGGLPDNKENILYFDTEQGIYDSHNVIKRIKSMAGTDYNLNAFNLRSFTPMERCQIIEYAFKKMGNKTGFCVIDGIADLAIGINDEDEASRVTSILLRLTKEHNCHIVTILHQNKNDNFATGHLGSSIMKKAEIVISVTKNIQNKNQSEVNCDMGRGVDFENFNFEIDDNGFPRVIDVEPEGIQAPPSFYESTKEKEEPPF